MTEPALADVQVFCGFRYWKDGMGFEKPEPEVGLEGWSVNFARRSEEVLHWDARQVIQSLLSTGFEDQTEQCLTESRWIL